MLWKLLKYDFRSMWRSFSLVWGAALVIALINRFTLPFDGENSAVLEMGDGILSLVTALAFFGVLCAMFVAVMIFVVQRFYRGLLGDEGYLMHTLPVRSWQLVLSKLLCAVFVSLASMVIIFLACLLLFPIDWEDVFRFSFFQTIWRGLTQQPDALLYLVEMCVMVALGLALCVVTIYLAMALGHLFRRRVVMSVAAFIALDILGSLYIDLVDKSGLMGLLARVGGHLELWGANAMILLPTVLMFLAVSGLLKHRLNLE